MESHRWWDNQWWLKPEVLWHSKYTEEQVTVGFEKLKEIFDEKWFEAQLDERSGHPICKDLVGLYPFKLDLLVKLGMDLKEIEGCKNTDKMFKQLRRASEFASASSVIEMAASLNRRKIKVQEFEPVIRQYNPDFSARRQEHLIYFEVKTLDPSAKWIISGELHCRIHQVFSGVKEKCYPGPLKVHFQISSNFWRTIDLGSPGSENVVLTEIIQNVAVIAAEKLKMAKLPFEIETRGIAVRVEKGSAGEGDLVTDSVAPSSLESELNRGIKNWFGKAANKQLPPDSPGVIGLRLFNIEPSYEEHKDLAVEIFRNDFERNRQKYIHVIGVILLISSYPILYEERLIENPYTKFGTLLGTFGVNERSTLP